MKNNAWRMMSKLAVLLMVTALAAAAPSYSAAALGEAESGIPVLSSGDVSDGQTVLFAADDAVTSTDAVAEDYAAEAIDGDEPAATDGAADPSAEEDASAQGDGWIAINGKEVYYRDGYALDGAVHADGLTYYAAEGYFEPVSGWYEIDGSEYYFENGIAAAGRRTIGGSVYFFDQYGALCRYDGWVELTDERTGAAERYYFRNNAAVTGISSVDGQLHYFDEQGRLSALSGWKICVDSFSGREKKCYLESGRVVTGIRTIDSVRYCFDSEGGLVTDGWFDTDEGRCYVRDGKIRTGFERIGSEICYLGENGFFMDLSGWTQIDGGSYLLSGGYVRTGIVYVDGAHYYLDENNNGRLAFGLIALNDGLYYAGADGSLRTGLMQVSGKWYYFGSDYRALSGWNIIDSKNYYFGEDGYALTGWFQNGGYYYYGGSDGAILTDCTVDGYKLDSNGRRQVSSELEGRVLSVIDSCTNDSMTDIKKLEACYRWVINNCSYKRDYTDPIKLASGWTAKYGTEMLTAKKGNCYRYAAAVAYLAEGLGYDAKVVTGKIVAYGGGMTAHGWAEVVINGKTYIFDANMDDSKSKFICFQKTYSNFPYKISKGKTYDVNL